MIEGDEIYNQVVGGHISAWKEGNHLDIFWDICIYTIEKYLEKGYDVIFNYIIPPKTFEKLKNKFEKYKIKFVILISSEEEILKRDITRPEDCQMKERCLILLNNFKNYDFDKKFILDTTNLTPIQTTQIIENENRFEIS